MKKMMIVLAVVAMAFAACGKKKDAAAPTPPAGDGSAAPAGDGSAAPAGDGSAAPEATP